MWATNFLARLTLLTALWQQAVAFLSPRTVLWCRPAQAPRFSLRRNHERVPTVSCKRCCVSHDKTAKTGTRALQRCSPLRGYTTRSDVRGCTGTPDSTRQSITASDKASRRHFLLVAAGTVSLTIRKPEGALAVDALSFGEAADAIRGATSAGTEAARSVAKSYTIGPDEVGVLFGDGPIGVKLGANPLKASGVCRVYVTEVLQGSQAIRQANLRAGFGVAAVGGTPAEKLDPAEVADLIRLTPRPMEIVFRDPEFLGKRLEAEAAEKAQAAKLNRRKAAADKTTLPTQVSREDSGELRVTQVGGKPASCGTKTKAGDLIEFRYSARLASDMSVEFDSSDRRGTGLPYAVVLGNGDVVKGLDLSLFDMCIGERRKVEIPARLAYGRKGSKLFGVPPDDGQGTGDVVYGVELVSINFNTDASAQRDNFYTDDPCDAAAVAAGNASGQCNKLPNPTG